MIEVNDIKICVDTPGIADKYVAHVRFIDPEQGTCTTTQGLIVWNYDKMLTLAAPTLKALIRHTSDSITEVLCREE